MVVALVALIVTVIFLIRHENKDNTPNWVPIEGSENRGEKKYLISEKDWNRIKEKVAEKNREIKRLRTIVAIRYRHRPTEFRPDWFKN
jgi:hypothetical protein